MIGEASLSGLPTLATTLGGSKPLSRQSAKIINYYNSPDHSELFLKNKLDAMDWSQGVTKHWQQYNAFLIAAGADIPIEAALPIVAERLEEAGAVINPAAVLRQAERAYEYVTERPACGNADGIKARQRPKPVFDYKALESLVADIPEISWQDLRDVSPGWADTAGDYLSQIYLPGEKVAVFDDMMVRKPKWIWEHGVDLNVPEGQGVWYLANPIDGETHPNPRNADKLSMRSEESITDFRYAVLECDHEKEYPGINNLWLRYLTRLPLAITAIYTSGNKSIHALVKLDATSKKEWDAQRDRYLEECVTFGADRAALSAVRLTRLPHARNLKQGTIQHLLYLNPQPTWRGIL